MYLPGLFIFLALPCILQATPISWSEAVDEAATQNRALSIAREELAALEAERKGSYSGFLPKFSATTSYQHSDQASDTNAPVIGTSGSAFDFRSVGGSDSLYSSSLTITQNLFAGFQDSARLAQATALTNAGKVVVQVTRASVSYDLTAAFTAMRYAQDAIALAKNILNRREENLRVVTLRYQGGNENQGSFLLSKASLEEAKLNALEAENSLRSAQEALAKALGRTSGRDLLVHGDVPVASPPKHPDLERLAIEAPLVQREKFNHSVAIENVRLARSRFSPQLDISSALSSRDDSAFGGSTDVVVGVTASVPIFSGGLNYYTLQASKARERSASTTVQETASSMLVSLQESLSAFREAVQRVVVANDFLHAAVVRAEIARQRYNNGLLSFEDWDIIESDLISRQKQALTSARDRILAEATWRQNLGGDVFP